MFPVQLFAGKLFFRAIRFKNAPAEVDTVRVNDTMCDPRNCTDVFWIEFLFEENIKFQKLSINHCLNIHVQKLTYPFLHAVIKLTESAEGNLGPIN